ncbi:MAG: spore germination protein [Ruminococcaceae bacterium]|nr:spore germination protein [Oscillospiraceae bacterium]
MKEAKTGFERRTALLDEALGVGRSFDIVGRTLTIGGRRAKLWVVNGYAQDAMLERIIASWRLLPSLEDVPDLQVFLERWVTACDASVQMDWDKAVTAVFSGKTLLVLDGYHGGILLEAKQFPLRSVEEPDTSKVLRGSHDGFGESLMKNAALLRRRIRTPQLTLERLEAGERSKTDIALCYMAGQADEKLVNELRQKISAIDVRSVAMSQESIAEAIAPRQWYNPFPKVRYTERPDVATACLMEGDVLVMVDNTPAVMILPTTFFRFAEEINDYYFPPLVGTYLQLVRITILLLTVFITPLWYLLVKDPGRLHENLHFLLIQDDYYVPLIVQLLLVELIVDLLKLASLNTPSALSSSFSMLGALILGDFAVQSRWLVPEVLVYMAFVAIANYAQHSYEMGYAFKLCRMALLILIWLADWWGFGFGVAGILLLVATTKPLAGKGYLYPLIPFNGKDMKALLHRRPISRKNT